MGFHQQEIRDRLSGQQGLKKAIKEFADAIEQRRHPKRVYKPSGVNRRGERFEPYVRLKLWHHYLRRTGEPLLVLQVI